MILVAPTAFKGTLTAAAAAVAMADGARMGAPGRIVLGMPLSDGGPGLIDAVSAAAAGVIERVRVHGPLGAPVAGRVLRTGAEAVIESADACGLHLVDAAERDPLAASTRGVGQLLLAAAADEPPPARIVVGLGGSATVDGGAGLATALGWRLEDGAGKCIGGRGGGSLERLRRVVPPDAPPPLPPVTALADVRTPLLGPDGAARVFGPQKGAGPAEVAVLESGLARLADLVAATLGVDVGALPGGGAAGGLGAGMVAFAGADLVPGSDWVLDAVGFDAALERAALVVTGEGSYDEQSSLGKVTGTVIARAVARRVPVLLVAGAVTVPLPAGVTAVDGGGAELTAAAIAGAVGPAVRRLLSRRGRQ